MGLFESILMGTAGGIFHDSDSRWLEGFSIKIGVCTSFRAELWGVLTDFRKPGIGVGAKLPWKLIMLVYFKCCGLEELCLVRMVILSTVRHLLARNWVVSVAPYLQEG
ncbi:uncharacterized protein LOC132619399 [Lycium barbarum]|uniref:uncharacterized protein LOC132619399 n=1 Tax=Lycium barbarum TaxID=112863 RepID=UPI00293E56C7|nr:uncharacterized protein LOC132619399 [Lycium barbarum]